MRYAFDGFELDLDLFHLRRCGDRIPLEPKVFDVLAVLVRERHRIVPKGDLLDEVWAHEVVTDAVLRRCVASARKALRSAGGDAGAIQTLHGRGYRFRRDVEELGADLRPGARETAAAPRPSPGQHDPPPLPGREGVLQEALRMVEDASSGAGRAILVCGEPGMGKTSVARALAAEGLGRGVSIFEARCAPGEGAPAFWPWLQILRQLAEADRLGDLGDQLGGGAAALLRPWLSRTDLHAGDSTNPAPEPTLPLPAGIARFWLFDGITQLLRRSARKRPFMLILEDLHGADPDSLDLLVFLCRELRAESLLVVGTFRTGPGAAPLPAGLADRMRRPQALLLELEGLGRNAMHELVERHMGAPVRDDLVRAIQEASGGNPLFASEILRRLGTRPPLPADRHWSVQELEMPREITSLIEQRLDGLSERCRSLLQMAAVIGREFDVVLLAAASRVDRATALGRLEEAAAAHVVAEMEGAPGRFRFPQALFRQVIYDALTPTHRTTLHRHVVYAIERRHGDDLDPQLAALAHHAFQALSVGDASRTVDYLERAGIQARDRQAFGEACKQFEWALTAMDWTEQVDPARRIELLCSLGEAQLWSGAPSACRRTLHRAAGIARRHGWPVALAECALRFAPARVFGEMTNDARKLIEEALVFLPKSDDRRRALLLAASTGCLPAREGLRRLELSERALECGRRSGDPAALLDALIARAVALQAPEDVDERMALGEEILGRAASLGCKLRYLAGCEFRIVGLLQQGEGEAVLYWMEEHARAARGIRRPFPTWLARRVCVARHLAAGRLEDANAVLREGFDLARRSRDPRAFSVFAGQLFWLHREQGRLARLRPLSELGRGGNPLATAMRGLLHLECDDRHAAQRELDALAAGNFRDIPVTHDWLSLMGMASELALALQDADRARSLYALLRRHAGHQVVHGVLLVQQGPVSLFLGRMARMLGWHRAARRFLEDALRRCEKLAAPTVQAHTRLQVAEAWIDEADRRERARHLAGHAGDTAARLGMGRVQRRAAALRAAAS